MALRAPPVRRLAVGRAQYVDLAGVGERLQSPVNRGQADGLARAAELLVDLLGGPEVVEIVERGRDSQRSTS